MRTWKVALRGLQALVEEKMVGSVVYDKFWVQGTCTKTFKVAKQVLRIHAQLAKIEETELAEQETWFAGIVQRELDIRNGKLVADDDAELLGELASLQVKEEKKSEEKPAAQKPAETAPIQKEGEWSPEEVANLTKAIVRFPPGTGQRWKVITEFVGTRTQKQTIKKAKDMAEKRQADMQAQQRLEREQKARVD